jgi:beta-glucanase (GH16 family)
VTRPRHRKDGRRGYRLYLLAAVVVTLLIVARVASVGSQRPTKNHNARLSVDSWSLRMVAGSQEVTDARGARWIPDQYALGGRLLPSAGPVSGTASPQLLASSRVGALGYDVPVPEPGLYAVVLKFVEPAMLGPGMRIFDVIAEQITEARSIDISKAVGLSKPYELLFTVPVKDQVLQLRLQARTGQTTIASISVALQSTDPTIRDVFLDDFNGPSGSGPDPNTWGYDTGGGGWGNSELETYTNGADNVALDGQGHLVITARRTGTNTYTSARLTTVGKRNFRYGTVEARIQVPTGQGIWPAFWAEGADLRQVGWPNSGELDVMEIRGSDPSKAYGTVVGRDGLDSDHYSQQGTFHGGSPLSDGYHTYGVLWTPLGMAFQVDSATYFTALPEDLSPSSQYPFDHDFFLLLNLAVGGTFGGSPDLTTPFPARMIVDWVRVVN